MRIFVLLKMPLLFPKIGLSPICEKITERNTTPLEIHWVFDYHVEIIPFPVVICYGYGTFEGSCHP